MDECPIHHLTSLLLPSCYQSKSVYRGLTAPQYYIQVTTSSPALVTRHRPCARILPRLPGGTHTTEDSRLPLLAPAASSTHDRPCSKSAARLASSRRHARPSRPRPAQAIPPTARPKSTRTPGGSPSRDLGRAFSVPGLWSVG
jgi:hypothetical protein